MNYDNLEWIDTLRTHINEQLRLVCNNSHIDPVLQNAVLYSITGAGKRLRPLIAVALAADLRSSDPGIYIRPEILGLEFLHLASLIHDDLPALDNDDYRRGEPTVHKVYGEGAALLTGDLMVGLAFEAVAGESYGRGALLCSVLARAWIELNEGQALDIEVHSAPQSRNLEKINRKKTAALFRAAFEFGAIMGGVTTPQVVPQFRELGIIFGKAFQQQDDATDIQNNDIQNKDGVKQTVDELYLKLESLQASLGKNLDFLKQLVSFTFSQKQSKDGEIVGTSSQQRKS